MPKRANDNDKAKVKAKEKSQKPKAPKKEELQAPLMPMCELDFLPTHAITLNVVNEFGEEVRAYIPQPSVYETMRVLPFLRRIYNITKEDEDLRKSPEILMADWEIFKIECFETTDLIKKDEQVKELNAKLTRFVDELLRLGSFIVISGEAKGKTGSLKELLADDFVKKAFEIKVLFLFALLRYASAISGTNEMRASYSALSFEEYHKRFMIYIEEMEAYLANLEEQEE